MTDYNEIIDRLRYNLEKLEVELTEKKEKKRMIAEKKDAVDADYEYIGKSVSDTYENITNIKRLINEILDKTGI